MSTFDRNPVATARHFVQVDRMFARMYRSDALADQRLRCSYCKERITRENATADHLVPRKAGGKTTRKNIKAACQPCNLAKGSMSEGLFRDILHSASIPSGIRLACAWVRFRLNRRVEKAERRICRAVGMAVS